MPTLFELLKDHKITNIYERPGSLLIRLDNRSELVIKNGWIRDAKTDTVIQIPKPPITMKTGGVLRCCHTSIFNQIGNTGTTKMTKFTCEYCKRNFIFSDKNENCLVPKDQPD